MQNPATEPSEYQQPTPGTRTVRVCVCVCAHACICPILVCSYMLMEGVTEQMHSRHHLSETMFVVSILQSNS